MNAPILHIASLLVPTRDRGEWLAEWLGELWHVERAGGEGIRFCLGAFRDALWLRRHATLPRAYGALLIESPFRCIAVLGFIAALSVAVNLVPAVLYLNRERLPGLLTVAIGACLVVPSTTSFSLGDYPNERHQFRRWLFLAAKLALLLPIVIFGALDVAGTSKHFAPVGVQIAFLGTFLGIRWALLDQRRRCPVCLRLLDKPVRIGQSSHIFLEWNGIELACLRGHGLLHVPGNPSIWFQRQRWIGLDSSWRDLFWGRASRARRP